MYVGRNVRTAISLARWSGMVVGGMLASRSVRIDQVEWVRPGRWRSIAFGLPSAMKRAEAKERVREAVASRYPTVARLASGDLSEHVADAIGLALYGVTTNNQQEDQRCREK